MWKVAKSEKKEHKTQNSRSAREKIQFQLGLKIIFISVVNIIGKHTRVKIKSFQAD